MGMKTCSKCKIEKSLEDFNWKNKSKNILHTSCKLCCRFAQKNTYRRSVEGVESRRRSNLNTSSQRRSRNRQFVWDYLLANPCTKCAESNPILLEFDHRDPTMKLNNVSSMVNSEYSIAKLTSEIEKCDVLCVRCHRLKTAQQFGWWCGVA